RRRQERTRIPHRLHVYDDALRAWIIPQVVDQVPPTHIEHGPDRHEGTEAHHLLLSPIEDRRAQRATLADESHIAAPRDVRRERGVQPADRIHHTQAVW